MSRRIAVSGASGLVGTALCRALADRGDTVVTLVRHLDPAEEEVCWNWTEGRLETGKLEGLDGFVHLAGKPIAVRWKGKVLREVLESRSKGTQLIAEGLAGLVDPPEVLVSASAIGIFGDGRERDFDDTSARGEGWMAGVCSAWESATRPAADAGIRVVIPRIGIVLSPDGGALQKMLPAFRFGVAGRIGDGKQGMSWIALTDLVRILLYMLDTKALSGPFVATAPNPVSNAEFTRTLARVLRRPAILPAPAFAISALFGEMGRRLILDGDFIRPSRLLETGFEFEHPGLEAALRHELGC
jgi:uncharacterized protein (TIGR01777 family)